MISKAWHCEASSPHFRLRSNDSQQDRR